jgi:DNA repair photolyase
MIRTQGKSSSSPKKTEQVEIPKEVVEEAQRWLRENKDLTIASYTYTSPRISSEIPDCSMPMTFDHYNFCGGIACTYCFAYCFKTNNPAYKKEGKMAIPLKAVNVDDMVSALQGKPRNARGRMMHRHFYHRKFVLHWGGLADPFCNFEHKNRQGFKLISALGDMNYPTLFSFKGADIFSKDYVKLFEKHAQQANFAFQVSIVTNSDELARQVEVGAPSTSKRLEAIKMLSQMGYWTILRLRPFIMGVTDVGLDELLHRALEAGINGVSVEWFALDCRINEGMRKRFSWMGQVMGTKDLQKYYSKLSPSERGGYMRLNRKVKEPYVKMIYKFCTEHNLVCGISDPDFKELNTSGSCCSLPDSYPKNPLLQNWTKNQLTYHLKSMRQEYHRSGKLLTLGFNDVYKDESYFTDPSLTHDHVSEVGMPMAARTMRTYRHILIKHWNNLNSPANPRNYLHGKLMPIGVDSEGDLVYRYEPMDYEERWKSEGIDLTR